MATMNIGSVNTAQTQEINRTHGLRQAAAASSPPALTEDESRMIHREFSGHAAVSYYNGKGEMQQQMLTSRGQHIDKTV